MRYKNNEPSIDFWTVVPGLSKIPEITPKRLSKMKPEWWSSMPAINDSKKDVRHCPSFMDVFSNLYVVPMWTDLKIKILDGHIRYEVPNNRFVVQLHHDYQFKDTISNVSDKNIKGIIKLINPWHIKTPQGFSIFQLPNMYEVNDDYHVVGGIIDTDNYHINNVQLYIKSNKEEFIIKRGTPLYYIFPFKRNRFNLNIREMTHDDYIDTEKSFSIFSTKFLKGYSNNRKWFS